MTLEEIVDDYRATYDSRLDAELKAYRRKATLEQAIRDACHGLKASGKRHIHQRKLPHRSALRATRALLRNIRALSAARNFHELQAVVQRLMGNIPWVKGKLNVYDTTFRIGGKLGKLPTRVYLHRGTLDGAVALGFDRKLEYVTMSELPKPLQKLKAYEVEDVLCLYKDNLAGARATGPRRGGPPTRWRRGGC